MKKLSSIIATIMLSILSLNAQSTLFGVKAGANFASAKITADNNKGTTSETGIYAGVFVELEVSDKLSLRPEAIVFSVLNGNYLNFPIMAAYKLKEKFSLLVGPNLGLLLDSSDIEKRLNLGIEAGAVYDITDKILIEARYNLGLTNLIKDAPSGSSVKLNGLFIGLGYRF